ncbi:hypothetical protein [Pseudomonas phage phiPstEGF]|uniref:Uncharacterized protein n=4 Tax=Ghunavirus TaxID=2732683 RepID=A0A7D0TP64_9CAUD|nr:hypothetical protein CHF1_13 [Pseudomonas phage CHF1]QHB47928.1 hypothetical protein CHF7_13 [Pseudomonas phage CHF7]QHB48024.1 hypothetical protein CHF21_13 [Pseudomonas phage CHF21]QHB48072.1 hypothetical protein CHF33_13 [Pseudomonas phage CHF33]WPH61321.1 hypothetical protein [Pseudomonas phage phiPst2111]WPH61367.1 hypothetical protein [Pseudomonas phage phiPstEGF]WPK27828.1 hypothetical protein [Pseudomonas phage phiPstE]
MSTAVMIATTAAVIAASSASHSGGGGDSCPISDFGSTCLIIFLAMCVLSGLSLVAAMTRHWSSKWSDRWFFTAILLAIFSIVPVTVGMIHDCQ